MTEKQIQTLRPGLLVSMKTSVRGNVTYTRRDLDTERADVGAQAKEAAESLAKAMADEGTPTEVDQRLIDSIESRVVERTKWETERTIADRDEFEAATKARSAAVAAVRRLCTKSDYGLLCPEADRETLFAGVNEARDIIDTFNSTSKLTTIRFNVLVGRIAADDVEAVKAINAEVRDLLDMAERGVKLGNVQLIRDAANDLRKLGQMLTPEARVKVQFAIDAIRGQAREIAKAADVAAVAVDQRVLAQITESRAAFLDLDEPAPQQAAVEVGRPVDLTVDEPTDEEREALEGAISDRSAQEAEQEQWDREREAAGVRAIEVEVEEVPKSKSAAPVRDLDIEVN